MASQKAVVSEGNGNAKVVSDNPIPTLIDDDVLVKVRAVAINPTDWKALSKLTEGCVIGVDYAGIVEKVSEGNVTRKWKAGDRIAGSLHGANPGKPEIGTFQEWTVGKTGTAFKIPGSMSFEEGSTLGAGLISVGQGLYQQLGVSWPLQTPSRPQSILIYGASSATGTLAVQFAKLSGLTVVATCSSRNFDLVKSRGADIVIDYSSPTAIKDIKASTKDGLDLILDCIGESGSAAFCYEAMGNAGGKYCSLLFPAECLRKDIQTSMVFAYTAYGAAFDKFGKHFPSKPEDYQFAADFYERSESLLAKGQVKPHPSAHRSGGIDGILRGLEELKSQKVSGQKLVFTISS